MSNLATFRFARFDDFTPMLTLAQKLGLPTSPIHDVIKGEGCKGDVWLVAEYEGSLLAFCHCKRARQANPLLKMQIFAVGDDWLEHGFGWAMMRYAEAVAKTYGARLIWLDGVTEYNWQPWGLPHISGNENMISEQVYNPKAAPVREARWHATPTQSTLREAA